MAAGVYVFYINRVFNKSVVEIHIPRFGVRNRLTSVEGYVGGILT